MMELKSAEDQQYLILAIQTVLYNNKNRLPGITDLNKQKSIIVELSKEIMTIAKTYKTITEEMLHQMEAN